MIKPEEGQLVLVYNYAKEQYYIWNWSIRSKSKADIGEVRPLCILPDTLRKDSIIHIEVIQ